HDTGLGARADGPLPDVLPAGGHPEPDGQPVDDLVSAAGRPLASPLELGRGQPRHLPPAPGVVPHILKREGGCAPLPGLPPNGARAEPALEMERLTLPGWAARRVASIRALGRRRAPRTRRGRLGSLGCGPRADRCGSATVGWRTRVAQSHGPR